ncbi:MAG TPA: MBL fold metallo-hydrolase, partial [Candidatus Methanoperedens sp.]|nr:MBL fold metallo-hydrolase [Candidatus Methanoperedens sp.]
GKCGILRRAMTSDRSLIPPAGAAVVRAFTGGPVATNVYLVVDEQAAEAVAIDPGGAVGEIVAFLRDGGLHLAAIVNTHGHFDHVSGNRALREATGAPIMMHVADAALAARAAALAVFVRRAGEDSPAPDRLLEEGDEVRAGALSLRVLHTPGHTPGGITLAGCGAAFCGDLLSAAGPGLTGLPGCSPPLLFASIRQRIFSLPGETLLYPGHGPRTTVAAARRNPLYAEDAAG